MELKKSAEGRGKPAIYMLVGSNLAELAWAIDIMPVYPKQNALQLAIKSHPFHIYQRLRSWDIPLIIVNTSKQTSVFDSWEELPPMERSLLLPSCFATTLDATHF